MATILSTRRSNAYTKLDNEDPEETKHRLAQFLIYKVLQQAAAAADSSTPRRRKRRSWLRIRMCRLKIRIGKRLKKLMMRKGIVTNITAGAHEQVGCHMKTWKALFGLI